MRSLVLLLALLAALGLSSAHPCPDEEWVPTRRASLPQDFDGVWYPIRSVRSLPLDVEYGTATQHAAPEDLRQARSLADLLEGLAPVAAATSSLLAGVANLGYAASTPYYAGNPWYGGYGGGYGPGFGYGYPFAPFRPSFPYFH